VREGINQIAADYADRRRWKNLAANCANKHEFNVSTIRVFSRAFAAKILISVYLRKSAANDFIRVNPRKSAVSSWL
jgi:hypothetical protein